MLSSRYFQHFFLTLALGIALFFIFKFGFSVNHYLNLKVQAPVKIEQWELEGAGDRWKIRAVYSLPLEKKSWAGATLFTDRSYLNEESAFRSLQELAKQEWAAWYCPNDPSISSLERIFPYNLLFRTLAACGVLIYFFLFQRWLVRKYLII